MKVFHMVQSGLVWGGMSYFSVGVGINMFMPSKMYKQLPT